MRWLFAFVTASRNVPGPESARDVTFTEYPWFPPDVAEPNPSKSAWSEVENIRANRITMQADLLIQGFCRGLRAW
jgi:hypothetical protein